MRFTVYKGSSSGKVVRASTDKEPPKLHQVLVRITHSGLCGTDEHYITQDIVLGHEGVGVVESVGESVTSVKPGDRVGWGYCHGSCGKCTYCRQSEELYCDERRLYGASDVDQGSFATHAIWDENFLFQIPEALSSAVAAPLMCAGAAVYSAVTQAKVQSTHRVGVLGMGGLGHLAIQFAAKMGCEVVVYSHSSGKKQHAIDFGATEFYNLKEIGSTREVAPVDCLLITAAKMPDWAEVIPLVRRGGVLSAMTVDPSELRFSYMDLVMNAVQLQGSLPAAPRLHEKMLRFAAFHQIKPMIEVFKLDEDGINTAMGKLRNSKIRYRGVLQQDKHAV